MTEDYFDEAYFLRGKQTGKSNYEDYKWLPDATLPMADWLKRVMHIKDGDTLLDVGCARGYLCKALRMRGVLASGYDVSKWAVANADPDIRPYVSNALNAPKLGWDFINMKDVAEHVPEKELAVLLKTLFAATRKSLLIIVPLTWVENGPYLRDEDNADQSHVIAWPMDKWMDFLHQHFRSDEGILTGSYHYPGLKPASSQVPKSCGFFQFTRV